MSRAPRRGAWHLLPLIVTITVFGALTFSLLAPALPDLAAEMGVSVGAIGMVQSAVALPGIVLAFFMGYLADLRGRRQVAVFSLVIYGLAGTAGYFVQSFAALVAVRAIQGIGTSGVLSLGVIVIGDLFPPGEERRRALSVNAVGITATGLVAPLLGGMLASIDPFLPFLVYALALPTALWARRLPGRPEGPRPDRPTSHLRGLGTALGERGRLGAFLGLLPLSVLLMILAAGVAFAATPVYLEQDFGLDVVARGFVVAVISVGSTIGALSTTRLVARLGSVRTLAIGFLLSGAGSLVVAMAPSVAAVTVALLPVGLGIGLIFPVVQDFVASSVVGAFRGAAVGVWITSVRFGQSIGPVLATAAVAATGAATYAGAGVVALVVAALLGLARSRLQRGERQGIGRQSDG